MNVKKIKGNKIKGKKLTATLLIAAIFVLLTVSTIPVTVQAQVPGVMVLSSPDDHGTPSPGYAAAIPIDSLTLPEGIWKITASGAMNLDFDSCPNVGLRVGVAEGAIMLAKSNIASSADTKIISRSGFSVVGAVEGPTTVDLVHYGGGDIFEYNLVAIAREPWLDPLVVTVNGDGSVNLPEADTVVSYNDAVDCTITIEDLSEDDVAEGTFGAVGKYVDVKVDDPTAVTSLKISVEYDPALLLGDPMLYWYDGSDWMPCSQVTFTVVSPYYITATITSLTSPSLADMTGTLFGVGGSIELDASFYDVYDTPKLTIVDPEEAGMGTIAATISNARTTQWFTLNLFEVDDSGLFQGSFLLVDTTPGTGELLVRNEDLITATYSGIDVEAYIDDMSPEISDLTPVDEDIIVDPQPTISATYEDPGTASGIDKDSVAITFNGVDVTEDADITESNVIYQIEEEDALTDGTYTVTVDVSDMVGNAAETAEWFFTVDTEVPLIEDAKATPSVVFPDTAATMVFTATVTDATSGVESVTIDLAPIGGVLVPMLDDGVEPDLVEADGVYTASLTTDGLDEDDYDLIVTATDKAALIATETIVFASTPDTESPVITDAEIYYPIGVVSARFKDPLIISATITDKVAVDPASVTVSDDLDPHEINVLMKDDGLLNDEVKGDGIYTASISTPDIAPDTYDLTITAKDEKSNEAKEILLLEVTTKLTGYYLDLEVGWNLFSLPLVPDESSIEVVLADIVADVKSVWAYDTTTSLWSSYSLGAPSDLTRMVDGKGYWINMDADANLIVSGIELPEPPLSLPSYNVVEGWNMIGFKDVDPRSCNSYLAGVSGDYARIYGFKDGSYHVIDFTVGTDENLEPGFGYWIAMTDSGTIYP